MPSFPQIGGLKQETCAAFQFGKASWGQNTLTVRESLALQASIIDID